MVGNHNTRVKLVAATLLALSAASCCTPLSAQSKAVKPELVPQYGHDFTTVSIAADGRRAITESFGTEDRVRLWDLETGSLIRFFPGNKAAISADGTLVAASSLDGPTHIFKTSTGENVDTLPTSNVVGIAAASHNSLFAIVDHPESPTSPLLRIYVWDAHLGRQSSLLDLDLGPPVENLARDNTFLQLAFTPDARSLVVGTSNWVETWSLPSGKRRFHVDNQGRIDHMSFSTDGSMFAATSGSQITIGMVGSGRRVSTIDQTPRDGCTGRGSSLAFSPIDRQVVTKDLCVRMWSYDTGKELWSAQRSPSLAEMMGSPVFWKNGKYVLAGNTFYDSHTGEPFKSLGEVPRTSGVAASSVSSGLAIFLKRPDTEITTWLWEPYSGRYERVSVLPSPGYEWPWAVSPDLETLVTSTGGRQISVRQFPFDKSANTIDWTPNPRPTDAATTLAVDPIALMRGILISGVFTPIPTGPPINSASFCASGKLVAIGGDDYSGRLFSLQTYQEIARLTVPYLFAKVALSDNCNFFAVGAANIVKVLDIPRNETREFRFEAAEHETVSAVAFSADNQLLIVGSNRGGADGNEYIWDRVTTRLVKRLTAHGGVTAVAFSRDERYALAAYYSGEILLWDLQLQRQPAPKRYHGEIVSAGFLSDNHHFFVSGQDGTIEIWNTDRDTALASVEFSLDGSWTVVAPDGRFDSDNLLANRNLRWRIPSRPFEPLPVEVFMRQYFEPNLLRKLVQGVQLPQLPAISSLNLAQPNVEILSVDSNPQLNAAVDIRVMAKSRSTEKDEHSPKPVFSGVYDLRLFRDGQLVGQWPQANVSDGVSRSSLVEEQRAWRKAHEVKLDANGESIITFHNVRLPRQASLTKVTFTAYAFNSDRVKSLTTPPFEYVLPKSGKPVVRRAYLITMGVNANQSHNLNLELAVSSAERARALLRSKLRADYGEVVEIPLYSDLAPDSNQVKVNRAKKADLKAVLYLLAGRAVDPKLREEVDPKHQLQAATPDDAVVLYVASHGYADPEGTFYLMPSNTGTNWGTTEYELTQCQSRQDQSARCEHARDLLAHSVSSSELAAWWSGVDGGQMVMILDSCHSGAVPGKEFRPGPLGDPGFGQLSYDKGMQILSASQPAQTEQGEWVTGGEGRTLLVDALETVAKQSPEQSLGQWQHGVEEQLPRTAQQLYPGLKEEDAQLPVLLDFTKKPNTTLATIQ